MNRSLAIICAAALLTLVAIGCAGTRFSFDSARQVRVGMTEAEVTKIMGRPYSVNSRGDVQVWIWSQANGFTGAHQSVSFPMRDGKVESVPKIPESFR